MLELFTLLFFSAEGNHFFSSQNDVEPIGIEILQPAKIPYKKDRKIEPVLLENNDTALWAVDLKTGKTLYEQNPQRVQNIASITKIMTGLIILDEHDLDEIVTIPEEAFNPVGAKAGFYLYEKVTVRTLLETLFVSSSNDSALALAVHNAGDIETFVQKMNDKAEEIGLKSAKFYNPTGLDVFEKPETYDPLTGNFEGEVYGNTMSAVDIGTLAQIAYQNSFIKQTVIKENISVYSADDAFFREKQTTNQLLGTFLNVKGLKTGYTMLAQECLVTIGETEDGHEIMVVILGSSDRFGETTKLLSWIYDSYEWK